MQHQCDRRDPRRVTAGVAPRGPGHGGAHVVAGLGHRVGGVAERRIGWVVDLGIDAPARAELAHVVGPVPVLHAPHPGVEPGDVHGLGAGAPRSTDRGRESSGRGEGEDDGQRPQTADPALGQQPVGQLRVGGRGAGREGRRVHGRAPGVGCSGREPASHRGR